jgi:hypothetical protein
LLLYGTLARYQRDLRSILVEFKVSNAPEAYAAIAELAGVSAREVGEALRAGSRLERIGLVENLISEHNITDLADLMKVSEKLPPVLMREYRDRAELMAVFTRPASKSALGARTTLPLCRKTPKCCAPAAQCGGTQGARASTCCCTARPAPARPNWPRWWRRRPGWSCSRSNTPTATATRLSGRDRYRSLQIAQVFLKGSERPRCCSTRWKMSSRPSPARRRSCWRVPSRWPSPSNGSVSGKAWVNQILESNNVPTIWVTNRIEQIDPAFRRRFAYHLELKSPPPGAREAWCARRWRACGERRLRRAAGRAQGPDAGADPHRRAVCRAGRSAARPVCRRHGAGTRGSEALIERQLRNADLALGNRSPAGRRMVTTYDLGMLNVECALRCRALSRR